LSQCAIIRIASKDKVETKAYDVLEAGQALRFSTWLQPMRRSIFVAAALAAASLIAPSASRANPMFQVTAASPGAITFSGSGTAQFNNSIGTNNSFQVGSSTNLGVNASTSSTPGYEVGSQAKLDLAGTSVLQQVIGTSGTFKDNTSQATSAYSAASSYAVDAMSKAGWGSSWETSANKGQYENEAAWQSAYQSEYKAAVSAGYEATSSWSNSNTQSQGTDGVISGNFRTVEVGSARAGGSSVDWSASASSAAESKYGTSYANRGETHTAMSESEWKSAYDAEYNQAYAQASAASNRYTDSSVTVRGIGSDANVAAASSSTFTVDIGVGANGTNAASTSTANGSAGANLSTSSFANQSQSSTASAFMQAFGGGAAAAAE
jgi:hypothetical protein